SANGPGQGPFAATGAPIRGRPLRGTPPPTAGDRPKAERGAAEGRARRGRRPSEARPKAEPVTTSYDRLGRYVPKLQTLPAGSRTANSREPYGWSVRPITISAPAAEARA